MSKEAKILMGRFGKLREQALVEREEGLTEEIKALQGEPLERRVEFLRTVPSAKGAVIDDLLADIRALQEGKGGLVPGLAGESASVQNKETGRKGGVLIGLLVGVLIGSVAGGLGTWMVLPYQGSVEPSKMVEASVVNSALTHAPPPISRWNSPEEEELYLALSRANSGLAVAAHCRGEGKVEVEMAGVRRDACLVWPPAE